MKRLLKLFLFGFMLSAELIQSQTNTVGLIMNDSTASFNGYTLFSPLPSKITYLIDNEGYLIHSWNSSYEPGQAVMLLEDGSLLRTAFVKNTNPFTAGGAGGRVEKIDWDGNLIWSFNYYSSEYSSHHDVEVLPNGNILLIVWEKKTYNEAVSAGRNPSNLGSSIWSEKIIEINPSETSGANIVWEWHVWDHLIQDFDSSKLMYGNIAEHPELINLNFGSFNQDWLHINSVRYNSERDEILLSVHNFSEIWIIDHSTTTLQAADHTGGSKGKGGDLIYRWGNPQAYGTGTNSDRKLYTQHDARWIESGLPGENDIIIFNNGQARPGGNYSTVDEISTPLDLNGNYYIEPSGTFGPTDLIWNYTAPQPTLFFAQNISGAERLQNGNTLICEGPTGKFFEVDSLGTLVWEYINPVTRNGILNQGETPEFNPVFKIYRYSPSYPGLAEKDLSRKGKIENYPTKVENDNLLLSDFYITQNYPNPFNPTTVISYSVPTDEFVNLAVYNLIGEKVAQLVNKNVRAGKHQLSFDASDLTSGVYFYKIETAGFTSVKKMIVLK